MNCWKEYVAYIKDNPNGYWFKNKLYGLGWTPARWQGWGVLASYVTVVFTFVLVEAPKIAEAEITKSVLLPILVATTLFIAVVWRTGEPLKWQWGKKVDTK